MTYSHLCERTAWAYVAATFVRAQGEVDTTGPSANCQLAAAHFRSRRLRAGGSDYPFNEGSGQTLQAHIVTSPGIWFV